VGDEVQVLAGSNNKEVFIYNWGVTIRKAYLPPYTRKVRLLKRLGKSKREINRYITIPVRYIKCGKCNCIGFSGVTVISTMQKADGF